MKKRPIVILCPHFAPDTAPTGEVITKIVEEFDAAGERVHVVTSLPWYTSHAIDTGWTGRLIRREKTTWGSIIRVHPFPGKNKRQLWRRAIGFIAFSAIAGICTLFAGGFRHRPRAIIAMSPPLTLGITAWIASRVRMCPAIFNIQDIFPDAAIETGAITNTTIIRCARWLEKISYQLSDAVVVLSEDLHSNVSAKLNVKHQKKIHVIPNFVDTERIRPMNRMTPFRSELNIGEETVVMYAGNVGFSQSLEMLVQAAKQLPEVVFVINGDGGARESLMKSASGLTNIRFSGYQPRDRVSEVLASADIHVVPLRRGLGTVSVPSKTYSILAAGRAVVASIDAGTEVTRILSMSGAGISVEPDDSDALTAALRAFVADPQRTATMGQSGREWVKTHVSPGVVARSYLDLITFCSR